MTVRRMVDVSGHNKAVLKAPGAALDAFEAAGINDIYIKATEGRSYDLAAFRDFAALAAGRGFNVGAYHFARPDTRPGDAADEAAHFCGLLKGIPLANAPLFDIETAADWKGTTVGLVEWCLDWLHATWSTTGRAPIVYTGPGFWAGKLGRTSALNGFRLMVAAYPTVIPPSTKAPPKLDSWEPTAWQYTGSGTVNGIDGHLDLSYVYGDLS